MVAWPSIPRDVAARDCSVNHALCLLSWTVENYDPHTVNNATFIAGRKYVVRASAAGEYATDRLV